MTSTRNFNDLGVKGVVIDPEIVKPNQKLLGGGIWCILQLEYEAGTKPSPFIVGSSQTYPNA